MTTDSLPEAAVLGGEPGAAAPEATSWRGYLTRRVLSRLGQLLALVVGISTLLFFLLRITGDPALVLIGDLADQDQIDQVRAFYGLDRPLIVQYFAFIGQALRLNFGNSLISFEDAFTLVMERLPATAILALGAIVLNLVAAFVVGTWLGYRPERLSRRIGLGVVLVSQGIPGFVIGLILLQVFAVRLGWLPAIGNQGLSSLILPSVTLASFLMPRTVRLTATNVDEAMRQDYVRTARADGASSSRILFRHVLPNALIGTVALMGVQFGFLLSGSLITESLFAWPGLGLLLIEAVRDLDFPVVQAAVAVVAVMVFAVSLLTDLLFPVIDPRLRGRQ